MPSERPQLNVRLDGESEARFDRLMGRMPEVLGVPVTQAQLIRLALKALEEKHPPPAKGKGAKK